MPRGSNLIFGMDSKEGAFPAFEKHWRWTAQHGNSCRVQDFKHPLSTPEFSEQLDAVIKEIVSVFEPSDIGFAASQDESAGLIRR